MSNLDAPTPAGSRPSLESLTKRQLQVLDAIRKLLEEQGFAPSLRKSAKPPTSRAHHRCSISSMHWKAKDSSAATPIKAGHRAC